MKSLRAFTLGVVLSALCTPLAMADGYYEDDGGLYISARGGLSQVRSTTDYYFVGWDPQYDPVTNALVTEGMNDHQEHRSLEMDYGFVLGGSIGYTALFPDSPVDLRIEAEAMYRRNVGGQAQSRMRAVTNHPDSTSINGDTIIEVTGRVEVRSVMINGLVDFHTPTRFTPYVGLGVGYSELICTDAATFVDDRIFGISLQGILGIGYHLSAGTMLFLEARSFKMATDRWSDLFGTDELANIKFDDWSAGVRLTF